MKNLKSKANKRLPKSIVKYSIITVLLLIVALAALFNGDIIAKYLHGEENDILLPAKNFYFESDYLAEAGSGKNSNYTIQEGVHAISFELRNYPDALRYSEVKISYTVTLIGLNIETRTITGVLKGNEQSKTDIVFDELPAGTYTVTAISEPYSKTLQGTFQIRDATSDISYSVSDKSGSPFLELVVTTTDYSGPVSFVFPASIRPDNTDSLLSTVTGNTCVIEMNSYSSYTFLFFKDDPSEVLETSDFTISKYTVSN